VSEDLAEEEFGAVRLRVAEEVIRVVPFDDLACWKLSVSFL
jgi:hypothetical protein